MPSSKLVAPILYLGLIMQLITAAPDQANQLIIKNSERTKTMNNPVDQKQSGKFLSKDKQVIPVVLEWSKTSIVSPDYAAAMKDVWAFARDAYTPVEMQFLKAFPEVIGKEPYFKPFEPLFQHGVEHVDWQAAEAMMQSILQGHFIFDPSKFSEQMIKMYGNDSAFLVTIKNPASGSILGFITYLMRANYAPGDIRVMSLAVDTTQQKRGLGKLLMSSIFKIIPEIKRIFLCTRVTNNTALKAYGAWGFVKDEQPVLDHPFNPDHWSFMDYKTEKSDTLQKTTASLLVNLFS